MTESGFKKAQADAEAKVQPILRKFHDMLLDVYMSGFVAGLEASEPSDKELEAKLAEEEEALVHLKKDAILQKRLNPVQFSTRTWNVFKANNINTLGDIVKHSRIDFLRMRNCGKTSLQEISDYVESFNYKLA